MMGALEQVRTEIDRKFLDWQFFVRKQDQISARIQLLIDTSKYRVRIADSNADFQKVMRLRYEVFIKEMQKKENAVRVDLDEFDFAADHLIVEDVKSDEIVGTYRLLCSRFTDQFYSESEFDLGHFLSLEGAKLELGRACIHKDHRRGIVISLLWRGILEYACKVRAKYLFGCASLWSNDIREAVSVYRAFKNQGHFSTEIEVNPTHKYIHPHYSVQLGVESAEEEKGEIPSLLRSYLKAGAKVCSGPAYDAAFECFDYFVIMNLGELDKAFQERFATS